MIPDGYKDRRVEGEGRLRQCQLVQLHLLHVVDAISKVENVPYFLVGGSLLGAMRHDGFIPWDDDLDIAVPCSYYKRFLRALRKHLPNDAYLQDPSYYKNSAICFAKVRDVNSFYYECRPDVATSDPNGIFLDIFPYENMPEIGTWLQKFLVKAIGSTFCRDVWLRNLARKGFIVGLPCLLLSVIVRVMHGALRTLLFCLKALLPCRTVYNVCELGLVYAFKKDDIYPLAQHRFEDGDFPVPRNADAILTAQYGNWREIPPIDKRPRHARIIDPFNAA